jgi:hypothetical protein
MTRSPRTIIENLENRRLLSAADPSSWIVAGNGSQNFGVQPRAINYINVSGIADGTFGGINGKPTFSIGGFEESENGNREELSGLASDPNTGDSYVLSFDSGNAGGTDIFGDSNGDYDLYRHDFSVAHDDFINNNRAAGVLYFPTVGVDGFNYITEYGGLPLGPTGLPSVTSSDDGIPRNRDNTDADPSNDIVFLDGVREKIGEVPRTDFDFDELTLEFVDEQTLLLNLQVDEVDDEAVYGVWTLEQISDMPGLAPAAGAGGDPKLLGGGNGQTTESWAAYEIGRDFGDLDGIGEPDIDGFRYTDQDGVPGFWVSDRDAFDPDGDPDTDNTIFSAQLAYFTIDFTNRSFAPGEFRVAGGTEVTNRFTLDENPVLDPTTNDGTVDFFDLDENGDLVISESDFFDGSNSDIITRDIVTYNADPVNDVTPGTGPEALFGGYQYFEEPDYTGLSNGGSGPNEINGLFGVFESFENIVYRFDTDSNTGSGEITADFFAYDLDTGSLVYSEIDAFNNFFGDANSINAFTIVPDSQPFNPADFNDDGEVDLADFTILRNNFGSGTLFSEGDADGDGDVDLGDFTILRNNFGASSTSSDDESVFA